MKEILALLSPEFNKDFEAMQKNIVDEVKTLLHSHEEELRRVFTKCATIVLSNKKDPHSDSVLKVINSVKEFDKLLGILLNEEKLPLNSEDF